MKLAVFDIDGTLTGSDGVDEECFVRALTEAHGIQHINTDWDAYPHTTDSGITLHIFLERFGRAPTANELSKLQTCFVELLKERRSADASRFAEIPGAASALRRLAGESPWAVALATGGWRASACLKLETAGIEYARLPAAFAEDGVSREEIVRAAISKALVHEALESFERVVSIGDGMWDVRAALQLGLPFLGVGVPSRERLLRQAGASHTIRDFSNFPQLLRALDDAQIPVLPRSALI